MQGERCDGSCFAFFFLFFFPTEWVSAGCAHHRSLADALISKPALRASRQQQQRQRRRQQQYR